MAFQRAWIRRRALAGSLAAIIIATAGATACTASTESTAPSSADARTSTVNWRPCPEKPEVECGTIRVPIDWAGHDPGEIDIAVARRKATDPAKRIGTLIHLPGGPGNSGVREIITERLSTPEINERFDRVSLDSRGTNRSAPVHCDADLMKNQPEMVPGNGDGSGGDYQEILAHNKKLGDSCRAHSGALVEHVDAVSVAKDVDALRAALGEEQLSIYGRSYGTLAAKMYAEQFPTRVRAMVLDSGGDHSQNRQQSLITASRAAEDAFNEFIAWCARDTSCVLHGRDIGELYDTLYERAQHGQLHQPGNPEAKIGQLELIQLALRPLYKPDWPAAAELLVQLESGQGQAGAAPWERSTTETVSVAAVALCNDSRDIINSEREWREAWQLTVDAAPTLHGHFGFGGFCMGSSIATPNPQHRLYMEGMPLEGTPPILLMNSLHDPVTSYEEATNVASKIKDSVLLTYDGWGHVVYDRNECTLTATNAYLLTGTLPAPGTHCPAT